ncbi:hypothetical protein GUITHDRAFT_149117 [Guillardia theta CCMP2712]|uniref:Uncharacterized protein n=1 Tax=Guillardia theta (strain CCMP2712) TaxID=905079 RepID=L1I780_GUITC|nr:hypothetical protein GUITHDRAFT_149117 [Guillardia theta CCMP2712]EKX31720.1 hypothetical protein GUITHDRAFT_149117 [Guillardia theta CCMP2712]|eukprot:XP_005818700.1 hypothetical protein GUITHDRAFT_149117 [Guillardia theta CCMP2712]
MPHPPHDQLDLQDVSEESPNPVPPSWSNTMDKLHDFKDKRSSSDLTGIIDATTKALRAALFENEEIRARNAELEGRLAVCAGGADAEQIKVEEIESALSKASNALAARREEVLNLEEKLKQVEQSRAESVESELQMRAALNAYVKDPNDRSIVEQLQDRINQLALENIQVRGTCRHLEEEVESTREALEHVAKEKEELKLKFSEISVLGPGAGNPSSLALGGFGLETIQELSLPASESTTPDRKSPTPEGRGEQYSHMEAALSSLRSRLEHEERKNDDLTLALEQSKKENEGLLHECAMLRERAQSLASAHEEMRERLAMSSDSLTDSLRESNQLRRELEMERLKLLQMESQIRLLSSAVKQEGPVDARIKQERAMMHEALDKMRNHLSVALDAQRRDSGRELRALREELTQDILKMQIAKEKAEAKLAELQKRGMEGNLPQSMTNGHDSTDEEVKRLREELRHSQQQQQALADFWSLEKQRFTAMEEKMAMIQSMYPNVIETLEANSSYPMLRRSTGMFSPDLIASTMVQAERNK